MGEWLHISTSAQCGGGGGSKLHVPPTLPRGRAPVNHRIRGWIGPSVSLDTTELNVAAWSLYQPRCPNAVEQCYSKVFFSRTEHVNMLIKAISTLTILIFRTVSLDSGTEVFKRANQRNKML
jgi:hypothetical protein